MSNYKYKKALFGYITLKGYIECITGLHVGGCADSVEIGGIDAPVIRNPVNGFPYIPGSSLKGKMRSIVEKVKIKKFERYDGDVFRHECDDIGPYTDNRIQQSGALVCPVCSIFGSTGKKSDKKEQNGTTISKSNGDNFPSPLIVKDCIFNKEREIYIDETNAIKKPNENFFDGNLLITEAKMENAIDRITAAAHPRTIERVPEGAIFDFEIIYKVESVTLDDPNPITSPDLTKIKENIEIIIAALISIEKDGLGGFTSRGSGQVKFNVEEFKAERVNGVPAGEIIKIELAKPTELKNCINLTTYAGLNFNI